MLVKIRFTPSEYTLYQKKKKNIIIIYLYRYIRVKKYVVQKKKTERNTSSEFTNI